MRVNYLSNDFMIMRERGGGAADTKSKAWELYKYQSNGKRGTSETCLPAGTAAQADGPNKKRIGSGHKNEGVCFGYRDPACD